jgi:hypothetical protein
MLATAKVVRWKVLTSANVASAAINRWKAVPRAERSVSRFSRASRSAPAMNIAVLPARTRSPPVERRVWVVAEVPVA